MSVKTKDGHRDKLYWEIAPYEYSEVFEENETLEAQTILLTTDRYPYMVPTEKILSTRLQALISEWVSGALPVGKSDGDGEVNQSIVPN